MKATTGADKDNDIACLRRAVHFAEHRFAMRSAGISHMVKLRPHTRTVIPIANVTSAPTPLPAMEALVIVRDQSAG
jgi:hypothetical protein